MYSIQRILHPTDLKEKSAPAFAMACDLARTFNADLSVIHVAPKGTITYLSRRSERDDDQLQEKLWQALAAGRPEEQGLKVSHQVTEGDAAAVIIETARETCADLLVVGPSSSTTLPWLWLNASTLDDLVHRAPCPVLISTPREDELQKAPASSHVEHGMAELDQSANDGEARLHAGFGKDGNARS